MSRSPDRGRVQPSLRRSIRARALATGTPSELLRIVRTALALQPGRRFATAEAMALDMYLSGEAAETFQAMADLGFYEQSKLHSRTSQYGGMMRSLALDREPMREHLRKVVQEVKDGTFAKQWAEEQASGAENFENLRSLAGKANPFTPIEERINELIREAQSRTEPAG